MALALIIKVLETIFCKSNNNQGPQQQQQQQQQGGYPGQQQFPQQQQQHAYPPQQQQQWNQVAGGHGGKHHTQQQYHQQQQQYQQHGQQQQQQQQQGHAANYFGGAGVVGPHHPQAMNQDMINATNDQYTNLRNQARHEGDEAHKAFAASQQAYQRGDGGAAHDLSEQGKAHQRRKEQLDDQASEWIFKENNKQSPVGTIDLHGLYVKEAIEQAEEAIKRGKSSGQDELRIIVGKGLHSQGHVAKIKPAVEDLMRRQNLSAHIDPHNAGVLIVDLDGREGNGRTRDAGGIMDELDGGKGDCVIM